MMVRVMVFLTGPHQVGKITACRRLADAYLDWDNKDHRIVILRAPRIIASYVLSEKRPKDAEVDAFAVRYLVSRTRGF